MTPRVFKKWNFPHCRSYWMVGYAAIFLNFVVFTAAFILFQLTSETVRRRWVAPTRAECGQPLTSRHTSCARLGPCRHPLYLRRWCTLTCRLER